MTTPLAPTWLAPSAPGQLTNKRGSNTGADSITFKARYANPRGGGDYAGQIRVTVRKSAGSQIAWDSGWVGTPTTSALGFSGTLYVGGSVVYGGRVYQLTWLNRAVGSAPISGGSVGVFRYESTIPKNGVNTPSSLCVAGGRLYIIDSSGNIYYASINGDGSLGAWTLSALKPAATGVLVGGQMASNAAAPSQPFLMVIGSAADGNAPAASTNVQTSALNADGSLGTWTTTTALPAARKAHTVYFDNTNGFLVVAGGYDGASVVQATIWTAAVTLTGANPVVGAWSVQTNAMPLALQAHAVVVTNLDATPYIFLIGGTPTTTDAGSITGVFSAQLASTVSTTQVGGWSAALAPALPVAMNGHSAFLTGVAGSSNEAFISVAGGRDAASGAITTVRVIQQTGAGALTGAWVNGAPAGLTAGNLGTGGAVTNNQDGTQDWTFLFGAFGQAVASALADGDVLTIRVQFTDVANGDAGPFADTVFKVGQAPTLSTLLPGAAISTGQPTASFLFLPGAGGGSQKSWQVTVKNGAQLVFDSGVRYDQANSVLVNCAPLLLTAIQYTFNWTATSTDDTFNGATNTVTSTLGVTPTVVAPAAPTSLAVTADNANGVLQLAWLNPTPPATPANRVYYRRYGANLLSANQASVETDVTDWFNNGNTAFAQSSEQALDGTSSLKMTSSAAGDMGVFGPGSGLSGVPVLPSTQYTFMTWFRAATISRSCRITVSWYQASGAASAVRPTDAVTANDAVNSWTQLFSTVISPSDAAFAAIIPQALATGAAGEVHYIDKISLAHGAGTAWTPGWTVGPWRLLVGTGVGITSYAAMDQIAFNVGYDFAVSQVDLAAGAFKESPLSNIVLNATLDLSTIGGCFLHVAGKGATFKTPLNFKNAPSFTAHLDPAFIDGFGLAPTVRYGPGDYHDIAFEAFIKDLATLQALQAVIAQALLGGTIYYRDGYGAMFTCGLDPTLGLTYKQPIYRYAPLKFKQIANLNGPYLTLGSALGIPALVNGSVPSLDSSENAL